MKVNTVEAELPQPNYTWNTISELYKKNTNIIFEWIIGSDNIYNLHQWHSSNELQKTITFCIIGRKDYQIDKNLLPDHYRLISKDIQNFSSSKIRKKLSQKLSCDNLLLREVQDYISRNHLYTS